MTKLSTTEKLRLRGVPGEEQKIVVLFSTHEHPFGSRPASVAGHFRVQFLLSRPGQRLFADNNVSFLDSIVGDSHLGIAKPLESRQGDDIEKLILITHGENWTLEFKGEVNDRGYLGKLSVDNVAALDATQAERIAYRAIAPFLSAWSLTLDIPLNIETIQVSDHTTHSEFLRFHAPFIEMKPGSGVGPKLTEEFCHYASVYREALNATSPFYRFICFYKIVESIYFRRSKLAEAAKSLGQPVKRYNEDVPLTRDATIGILGFLYPWRKDWDDDLLFDQLLPTEAIGKRFKFIRANYLEPLRNGIAHGLMRSGEIRTVADRLEDVQEATKWLPLLRVWVRLLLKIEFPTEFGTSVSA